MATNESRKLFVNIAVRDLAKSMEFFTKLGFTFNQQFTDDKAACLVISGDAYFMLLTEPFFRSFTDREPADTTRVTEGMFALSCSSRAEVDEMVRRAIDAGGAHARDPIDQGFMYGWSFYDLDGHHWEVLWMDPNAIQ
jgi:predicted lactoylglutathione lyase